MRNSLNTFIGACLATTESNTLRNQTECEMTQREVAEAIGVSRIAIQQIETKTEQRRNAEKECVFTGREWQAVSQPLERFGEIAVPVEVDPGVEQPRVGGRYGNCGDRAWRE